LQSLERTGIAVETLVAGLGRSVPPNGIDVALGGPDVPPAPTGAMRMRGAADAEVLTL